MAVGQAINTFPRLSQNVSVTNGACVLTPSSNALGAVEWQLSSGWPKYAGCPHSS